MNYLTDYLYIISSIVIHQVLIPVSSSTISSLQACLHIMVVITFQGDENLLEVIKEKRLNYVSDDGFINRFIENQRWSGYAIMLRGPIYPNLLKNFWLHVSISPDENAIRSYIFGFLITITCSSIKEAI